MYVYLLMLLCLPGMGVLFWGCLQLDKIASRKQAALMGYPFRWSLWTGSMIEVDGQWTPMWAYRVYRKDKE